MRPPGLSEINGVLSNGPHRNLLYILPVFCIRVKGVVGGIPRAIISLQFNRLRMNCIKKWSIFPALIIKKMLLAEKSTCDNVCAVIKSLK